MTKNLICKIEYLHSYLSGSGSKFIKDMGNGEVIRQIKNFNRRERDQVMRDCGLVAGRDSMGRRIWE